MLHVARLGQSAHADAAAGEANGLASRLHDRLDDALVLALRNRVVAGVASKINSITDAVREHKVLAALGLVDIDAFFAIPASIVITTNLYRFQLTSSTRLPFLLMNFGILFAVEYGIVNAAVAAYDSEKLRIVSRLRPAPSPLRQA